MPQNLDDSVLRVLNSDGETVGTAFLVSDRLAVTCAHVVKMAGGAPGGTVPVRFYKANDTMAAQVRAVPSWSPVENDDAAFLDLPAQPDHAKSLRLYSAAGSAQNAFTSLGFPKGSGMAHSRRCGGTIKGLVESKGRRDWLQVDGDEMDPGMSGAPVLDVTLDRVVGMVTWHEDVKYKRIVHAVTSDTLKALLPGLAFAAPEEQPAQPARGPLPPPDTLPDPGRLPPGARMPFPRNAVFTGRQKDLLSLAGSLIYAGEPGKVSITQPVAAAGLGGIGKTQLAVEFCYRYGRWLEGIHWIGAAKADEIGSEIASCGMAMGLPNWPGKLDEQIRATLKAWQAAPDRLVVLDNLEEPEGLRPWLPHLTGLRLLVTTRRASCPAEFGLRFLRLDVLSPEECRVLLCRLAPRLEQVADEDLDRLSETLGRLPLAVDLAGRYLEEVQGLSIPAYLVEMEKAGSVLAHISQTEWTEATPTGHAPNLEKTFALSWQRIGGDGRVEPLARTLFQSAGTCAPNTPIPDALLWSVAEKEQAERAVYERAKRRLADLGLVNEAGQDVLVHPLLSQYARGLGDAEHTVLAKLADRLALISNTALETGLPGPFLPLLAHVEEVALLAEGAGVEDAGSLWNNLGYHKQMTADYRRARACFERALRIVEKVHGSEHPDVAIRVSNLGGVLQDLGDLPGARACFERALRIGEQVYGPEHPRVAILVSNLGLVLRDLGDLTGAKACFERALRISEQVYGPEHPQISTMVNNLGMVLQAMGDLPGARACYERGLRIGEQVYGPAHPQVATLVNNLGSVLQDLGDLPGARACFERALRIDEQVYGPEHPMVAIRVNNLGSVLYDLVDLPGARACFERALRIGEQVYGPGHPQVAIRVNNLGGVLYDLGDLPGARACFERALRIGEQVYGPEHPDVAIRVNNLGGVLQDLGNLPGARACYERALRIFCKFLPADHPNIKIVRKSLEIVERQMRGG